MTNVLHNNRYTQTSYDPTEKLIKQTWTFQAHKNQLHFFGNLSGLLDIIYTYNPQKLLIDFSNFVYPLDQDIRAWVINHFFVQLRVLQIKKIALIKSKDQATQQTLELVSTHSKVKSFNIHFFDEENWAQAWFQAKYNANSPQSSSHLKAS